MTGTTIAQAIPIAISPILTRIYTPEDFGVFTLFLAITGIFSVIATGRYELALMLPRKEENTINIFALGIIIILLLTGFLFGGVFLFHSSLVDFFNNQSIGFWLYFVPIAFFFIGFFNLLTSYNNRQKKYDDIANAVIIKSVVLAIVQLLVGFFKAGASGLISGQIVSSLFANLQLLKNIIKERAFFSKVNKIKMIALAKRYSDFPKYQAPHAMLNTLSSYLPVYLFTPFFGLWIVGLYALSLRIVFTPMMILAGASAKVYSQQITQLYNSKGDAYGFTVQLLKKLSQKVLLPFLVIVIFAPEIFGFAFGTKWREAGVYTQILAPWLWMVFFTATVAFIPSLLNRQKKAFVLEIIYTVLRIIGIGIGLWYESIYVALIAYSAVGFLMLNYNLWWMLTSLKKVE